MADETSLPEVMREVQRLVKQVESLIQEVRSDYVRKELYRAENAGLIRRIDELEEDAEKREQDRKSWQRQVLGGVAVGVILLVCNVLATVILTQGVGT